MAEASSEESKIDRTIKRIERKICELKSYNANEINDEYPPELKSLSLSIKDLIERIFADRPSLMQRYQKAGTLFFSPSFYTDSYPQPHHYIKGTKKNIANAVAILESAIATLELDLEEVRHSRSPIEIKSMPDAKPMPSNRVFIVHGHDEGARESVARFLTQIGYDPIILNEQANQGATIIEKIERNADVGFAVILLTPDDLGSSKGGKLMSRARQNVILELGYFYGRLGRANVCALHKGDVELPSDFSGIVWTPMDSTNGWKQALGKELQAAGYSVDWNKIMS